MSIFNDDRSTFNQAGTAFDEELSRSGFDAALKRAFDSGMNLDEISHIVYKHTERIISSHVVQYKLKKAANKTNRETKKN